MSRAVQGRPKQAAVPSGAEAGHPLSGGNRVPAEGLQQSLQRGLQGRPMYSSDERLA